MSPGVRASRRMVWLLLPMLLAGATAFADSLEDRARRLAGEFVDGWVERHPGDATRLGDHERDDALPLRSRLAREKDAAWYAARRDSFAALPLDGLGEDLRIDVRLAQARAELEVRALAVERLAERDPGDALRELRDALRAILRGHYSGSCARTVTLRSRLRAVPEFLRDTRLVATAPERVPTEQAIVLTRSLLRLCREEVAHAFTGCREARLQADLAVGDTLATRALEGFAEHLRDHLLPDAPPGLPIDSEGLAVRLAAVAGAPVELAALLTRARTDWRAHTQALAGESGASLDEFGRIDADSAESMLETMQRMWRRAGRMTDDVNPRIDATDRSAPAGGARLVLNGPWDRRAARARLELGPALEGSSVEGEGALAEDPMYSSIGTRIALAHDGFPGRAAWAAMEARHASRVRQALGYEAIREGWARYAESAWIASRPESERALAAHRAHRRGRERAARAIAELMIRVEGASVDDAARWLEEGASLSADAARRGALEAATDPRWAAALVAAWGFLDLRDAAEAAAGTRFDEAAFHDALLRAGAVPTAWIADRVVRAAGGSRGQP